MSKPRRDHGPTASIADQLTLLRLDGGDLNEDTDYLYCPICQVHVPCRRLASGGWEVDCAGCQGECAFCTCYLKRFCFGNREMFPPFEKPNEGTR